MKNFLCLLPFLFLNVACDKINALMNMPDTLSSMKGTTEQMNAGMGKTNEGIHKQTMSLALAGLKDKNNWDELNPAPFKMMPYGQAFAEAATSKELMDYFQSTLKELNEAKLDLSTDWLTGETTPYIADSSELKAAEQEKMANFTGLSIIAGFTPQSMVEEIISQQVVGDGTNGSGMYSTEAIAFMALRAQFIHDVLLVNRDLAQPLANMGKVEMAVNDAELLDFIAKLPQADQFKVDVKPEFHVMKDNKPTPLDMEMIAAVDVTQPLAIWKSIRTGLDNDLQVGQASVGVSPAEAAANSQNEQARAQAASQTVNQYLGSWASLKN